MSSDENKQLVQRGYMLFKNGNIQELLNLYTDDIEWTSSESIYIPFSGTYRGKDQVAEFFMKLAQAQEAQRFEPEDFIADGDKVVVTGQATWKVRSTGRTYENPWVHVFMIRDGKVARFQHYDNTAAAEAAFMPTESSQQKDNVLHH